MITGLGRQRIGAVIERSPRSGLERAPKQDISFAASEIEDIHVIAADGGDAYVSMVVGTKWPIVRFDHITVVAIIGGKDARCSVTDRLMDLGPCAVNNFNI